MAKEKKSYKTYWLDEEGNFTLLETGVSSDLKNELFNMICKMIMTAPNIFRLENGNGNIRKMIKTGVYIDFIGIAIVTIPVVLYLVGWIVG